MTDEVTRAVVWLIEEQGYNVTISGDRVTATALASDERYVVRGSPSTYDAVCELARLVRIELDDG